MDLDIIRKLKFPHLKANFATLALKHKIISVIFLLSILVQLAPHETYAQTNDAVKDADLGPLLVFNLNDTGYQDYLEMKGQELSDQYYQDQLLQQDLRLQKLTQKVLMYLKQQGSPLAEYAGTLVTLRNWKKIVALANAESGMCRHYPVAKANCWGIGGSNLWNMGNNLGQGVIEMNHFLNKYPLGSPEKYSQMSFDDMNGLYKQPAAQHWVDNILSVYDDLVAIENNL
ncbi:MAG: hypothetical protein ABI643_04085 [Candidatus Doudnabacteria bacterium]